MDNAALKEKFFEKYHGLELQNCIQCGSCSGSCPLAPYMDYGPRQLFELAREGDMEEVLKANTTALPFTDTGTGIAELFIEADQ